MPVAINGVDKQGVAINGVQVKQALDATNETVNKGVYDPTTLSAVDADLAAANIKEATTIFGFLGTLAAGAIVHDTLGSDVDDQSSRLSFYMYVEGEEVSNGGDSILLTTTLACAQATVIEAAYFVSAIVTGGTFKLQMYIDGVAQGETAAIDAADMYLYKDTGHEAVASGNRTVYLNAHNYGATAFIRFAGGIFAGCTKL